MDFLDFITELFDRDGTDEDEDLLSDFIVDVEEEDDE